MSTIEEFTAAVESVDARLAAMHDDIVANPERPLLEGTWRVRDSLSHLAARANGVARVFARLEAADAAGGTPPAPRNVDEINAGQVDERTNRSIEELLTEIAEGHQAALAAVREVDAPTLERRLAFGFRPGDASVAEMLVMGGPRHDHNHLDQIEAALKA